LSLVSRVGGVYARSDMAGPLFMAARARSCFSNRELAHPNKNELGRFLLGFAG